MIKTNLDGIPEELKQLPQWVCFDITEDGKQPFIPGTKSFASPNRPKEWRTFDTAWMDVEKGRRTHVGFCFSSSDPYVFIDLDDPEDPEQQEVFKRINTYAQASVGGQGVHLICKGSFEGPGRHPGKPHAGIFQENRFCVMTGEVIADRDTIEVVDEDLLQAVHSWLSNGNDDKGSLEPLEEIEAEEPDMTIYEMGCDTFNRYRDLSNGKWQQFEDYGNDHSTADHAFIAMLCDLTDSNEQVRRMFQFSGMWSEERAEKKSAHGSAAGYINRSIAKVRAKQKRDRDLARKIHIEWPTDELDTPSIEIMEKVVEVPALGARNLIDEIPPGLMREIAEYSFRTSYLPLQEASVCVAYTLLSGVCGRGYLTPTNSGLNLWIILVGGTSCGKDEHQAGLKRIIHAVSKNNINIRKIFGGEIVSGPGLETTFQETPRYISYIPEFGDTFKSIACPNSPEHIRTLTRGLLNSFNSAGKSGSSEGRRKAQGSDDKTYVDRPCLCLAGECTPESLYGSMSSRELSIGLLQRFILMDVADSSWSLQENPLHAASPPSDLLARLDRLALLMDSRDQKNIYAVIESTKEADEMLREYRIAKRRQNMESKASLVTKEVLNRAGLKALRLASLCAVSADFDNPILKPEHAEYGIKCIERSDSNLLRRFTTGDVGSGQVKQEMEVVKAINEVMKLPKSIKEKLGFTPKMIGGGCITYQSVKERVVGLPAFANDKLGAVTAFDRCIEGILKSGTGFAKVSQEQATTYFNAGRALLLVRV